MSSPLLLPPNISIVANRKKVVRFERLLSRKREHADFNSSFQSGLTITRRNIRALVMNIDFQNERTGS